MASEDNSARAWLFGTASQQVASIEHKDDVTALAFSADGKYLATASRDKTARVCELVGGEALLVSDDDPVLAAAFSPNGEYLATAGRKDAAEVWEVVSGKRVAQMDHGNDVTAVAFSPDGKYLATASWDKTARVWEWASNGNNKEVARMGHGDWVRSVSFSQDGKYLATASDDKTARVWEALSGKQVAQMDHQAYVTAVAFSPNGKFLATGCNDDIVRVWPITIDTVGKEVELSQKLGKQAGSLTRAAGSTEVMQMLHHNDVTSVAFSRDGKYLATASRDKTARVWEALNGKQVVRMNHQESAMSVAFSEDGKYLATGAEDNMARVWEWTSEQEVARMSHRGYVRSVAFSPDGKYLATASDDKTAQIWFLEPEDLKNEAYLRVARNLTYQEWKRYFPGSPYAKTRPDLPIHPSFVEAGRDFARQGELEEAIAIFRRASELDPNLGLDPKAEAGRYAAKGLVARGEVLARTGDVDGAIALFKEALGSDPNLVLDPKTKAGKLAASRLVAKGQDLAGRGDVESAIDQFQRALELDPGLKLHPQAEARWHAAMGWVHEGQKLAAGGKVDDATVLYAKTATELEEGLRFSPDDERLSALLGRVYHEHLFDYEAAYEQFRKVLELKPDNIDYRSDFAEANLTRGRFEDAYKLARELLAEPAASRLAAGQKLAMRFIAVSSPVLQGRTDDGDRELEEFISYYNSIVNEYEPGWSYKGTRNFIVERPMDEGHKKTLLKLIEILETPIPNTTLEGARGSFHVKRRPDSDVKGLEIGARLAEQAFVPDGGTKWYSLRVTDVADYQIDVTSESRDPKVDLYGPDDVLEFVGSDDDGGEGYDSMLRKRLGPGEYYLGIVEVNDEEGSFNVEVRRAEMPKPGDMTILQVGSPLAGQAFAPGGETRWYRFRVTDDDTYQIDVTSESGDPKVDLYGPDDILELVGSDDDGGEGYDSRLRKRLRPGEYYLGIVQVDDKEGSFNVEVRRAEMPKPGDMTILQVGSPLAGQAFAPDGETRWYRFRVTDDDTYQIDVTSESRDPAISLYGPDDVSELVGSNDDWGEGLDSRLRVRLRPGEYYLGVRQVDDEEESFGVIVRHGE